MITRVTITGADDSIEPQELFDLTNEYPFVEWGILFSNKQIGKPRFPSKQWIEQLAVCSRIKVPDFSMHLCGELVRNFLKGTMPYFTGNPWAALFGRVQLNTHGEPHEWDAPAIYRNIKEHASAEFIFQYDDVNTDLVEAMARYDDIENISTLFDLSHGAGIAPKEWPRHLRFIKCGYAGGLGPDNLAREIPRINEAARGREIWIDMETQVRTMNDKFDLEKVEKALKICAPFIGNKIKL